MLWCENGCSCFRPSSSSVHTYWTVAKGRVGTSRKQHSCDDVCRYVVPSLIPPTMRCRRDSFVQAAMLWSESATVSREPTGEAGKCCKMKWSLLRLALSCPSACAELWQQAHPECQETVFWPHLCLQLVTDVPHCSAHGHVAAAPKLDISDFSDGAEQEQGKDHFANTALGVKTEKQHWLYLVGEF